MDEAEDEAAEAARVLAVAEAAEAEEEEARARLASASETELTKLDTWEEVPNRRRRRERGSLDRESLEGAPRAATDAPAATTGKTTSPAPAPPVADENANNNVSASGAPVSASVSPSSKDGGEAVEDGTEEISSSAAPGLENQTGQHSCFVNVVVQTLWGVTAFRDEFLEAEAQPNAAAADRSIFAAMKDVCSMMEAPSADAEGKSPKQATALALKEALYRLNAKFALGEMHDATEAREALLDALHRAIAIDATPPPTPTPTPPATPDGPPKAKRTAATPTSADGVKPPRDAGLDVTSCIRRVFSMRMRMTYPKSPTKGKDKPSEPANKPVDFEQWTQYVFATELREAVRDAGDADANGKPEGKHGKKGEALGPLLRVLRREAGADAKPGTKGRLTMLRAPKVFTLGLASDSAHASKYGGLPITESRVAALC